MTSATQDIGTTAEERACHFLLRHGLTKITANYHAPCGEIDLIMRDHDNMVFVEVRKRRRRDYGSSVATVAPYKKNRIIRTALHYLQHTGELESVSARFDVVGFDGCDDLVWIKDAFRTDR